MKLSPKRQVDVLTKSARKATTLLKKGEKKDIGFCCVLLYRHLLTLVVLPTTIHMLTFCLQRVFINKTNGQSESIANSSNTVYNMSPVVTDMSASTHYLQCIMC